MVAYYIIKNKIFETITILVIIVNSIMLALENPTQTIPKSFETLDNAFLGFYTFEAILKVTYLYYLNA